jgi:hypothetical protein
MDDEPDAAEALEERRCLVQIDHRQLEPQLPGQTPKPNRIAPGKERSMSMPYSGARDQLSGKAIGAVDHPSVVLSSLAHSTGMLIVFLQGMITVASYNYPGEVQGRLLLQVLTRELTSAGMIDRMPDDSLSPATERKTGMLSDLSIWQKTNRGEDKS